MKIKELRSKLKKYYPGVECEETKGCIRLTGTLDNYQDIISCGYLAVDKKRYIGVLNDIKLKGYHEVPMRVSSINDKKIDNLEVDCLVIGGGISGCSILRELTRYNLKCLLVEKESDLAMQASGRNDGEVHPGVDLKEGTLKQYYVIRSNPIFQDTTNELGVKFERVGQYAVFDQSFSPIAKLFAKMRTNIGCPTKVASKKEVEETDPYINKIMKCAISNPQAGIVSPYELTIAFAENAVENGAMVSLDTAVLGMELKDDKIISVKTNRGTVYPKVVINASGCFADKIAEMANDRYFTIHPRSGSDFIFDKESRKYVNHISSVKHISLKKSPSSHSKGGGILPTTEGNVLIGPNAYEVPEREDFSLKSESFNQIFKKEHYVNDSLEKRDVIAYFTGTRASTYEEDFYISKGRTTANIVHCAGIQSPGLTTSPLVAKDVARMAKEVYESLYNKVEMNNSFNPKRKVDPILRELKDDKRDELIKKNPLYGKIVCRCEEISEGEIIDALNRPIVVPTINGIKRRVRPGMGRCQGGFCMPLVAEIIAKHENKEITDVDGKQLGSKIVYPSIKGGKDNE